MTLVPHLGRQLASRDLTSTTAYSQASQIYKPDASLGDKTPARQLTSNEEDVFQPPTCYSLHPLLLSDEADRET